MIVTPVVVVVFVVALVALARSRHATVEKRRLRERKRARVVFAPELDHVTVRRYTRVAAFDWQELEAA